MRSLLMIGCLFFSLTLFAADDPLQFENSEQQQRYQQLLEELRCLVCQNQTLADSHADLAQDLRNEVYKMVAAGQTNDNIIEFLVSRYGDFVLYRPPLKWTTILLWFGPFALLLYGLVSVYRFVRKSKTIDVIVSPVDRQRLSRLLDSNTDKQVGS
jgi:cytochrome c-type biogenesis protein CcmH